MSQPSQEQVVQAVYAFAAEQMKNGSSPEAIRGMLVAKGLDQESAAVVVSNLAKLKAEATRAAGRKNMLYGALWCIGGIVLTVWTYTAAASGGRYVVASGAIVFGAIQFFRGLNQAGI